MVEAVIAGVGMHRFGRFPEKSIGELGRVAVSQALEEAGFEWAEIPILYAGAMQAGSGWGHAVAAELGQTGIPIVNVEAACASGIVGLHEAYKAVSSGIYDVVCVVGVEQQKKGFIPTLNLPVWQRVMGLGIYPAYYAMMAQRHMFEHGTTAAQLAALSVKSHKNASLCPNAHYQQFGGITAEDVLNSRMICDPLTLYQIAPVSDGAAAVVVTTAKLARQRGSALPTRIDAVTVYSGHYDPLALTAPAGIEKTTAERAYAESGMGPEDLDVVECQDATTIAEIHTVEALGLCAEGEGGPLTESQATAIGGRIPVNTDGGYLSRGNATGATGLAGLAEIVWQLRDQAGPRQTQGAKVGLNETLGAGPTCSVTIVSR